MGDTGHPGQTGLPGQTRQPRQASLGSPGRLGSPVGSASLGSPVTPSRSTPPAPPARPGAVPQIVLPHGGYKKLIVYRKSDVIYQGTVVFCRRFLPEHGDRTVDQMTQAARARDYAREHADWDDWQNIFETRPAETVANLMLTLCHQTCYMLDNMIAAQEEDFKKHGGVRERMHAACTAARGEDWDKGVYSRLDAAVDAADLMARASEIKRKVDQTVWSIKRRKGWQ